jgi:hypothetical protein
MQNMNSQRLQGLLFWAIVVSETSHVFCCVLPTLISLFSLLAGLGLMSVLPAGWLAFHEMMHRWEIPMIALSGGILVFGWVMHFISRRLDCHSTGCGHGPCAPEKNKAVTILKIASVMFAVNIAIYYTFHVHMNLLAR